MKNPIAKIFKYLLPSLAFLICSKVQAQDAYEIIKKADDKMQGVSSKVEMSMTIVRPDWSREVKIKSWAKGQKLSLILIEAPARDKGTAFLKRHKEIWNWQPKIDRVIKLPPSMMMQSWMGSDFTNDDLVKESSIVNDYYQKVVADTTIQGYECYKIEMLPKEDAAVVWGKIYAYISKADYLQLLFKYYDEEGYLINTMKLSDIKKMDDRVLPTRLEMIPADEEGHKTVVQYNQMKFNINIDDNFFSMQNMKRIR
ncbi:outer membrane lipoprotein-sorting protein [Fulvivirgaceae bacterium BMA10]|uniref:Outer membrane lipoprotein-sorting protein n=1 Tax=Splendidivirga corallicola TaxID=3051826 RepID=A0ABT8KH31_9BACT|nr:outer membrane lipoprotein-sorting protein [Fulvivirgaceae bacterium BMA10]